VAAKHELIERFEKKIQTVPARVRGAPPLTLGFEF
jgi:hypothetical protein